MGKGNFFCPGTKGRRNKETFLSQDKETTGSPILDCQETSSPLETLGGIYQSLDQWIHYCFCSESTQHKTGKFYLATGRARLIGLGQGLLELTFWKGLILNSISGTLSKFMKDKTLESMKLSQLPQRYKATACLARRKPRISLISLEYSKFYHS